MSISLKFPIQRTIKGGVMNSTETSAQAIRTNLIFLLTTKPGNRVMREECVSPIYNFIMEPFDEITENELKDAIKEKIYDYIPQITILSVSLKHSNDDDNLAIVTIIYSINALGVEDNVKLIIPTQEP